MTGKYRVSEKAISDLEKIWLYTFPKWSLEQANRYYSLIINEIEYVAENFNSSRNADYIGPGYSMSKIKSHLIFCKKTEDGMVEIIRILHQNIDIKNRLKEKQL